MILNLMCRVQPDAIHLVDGDLEDFAQTVTYAAVHSLAEALMSKTVKSIPGDIEQFLNAVITPLLPSSGALCVNCQFANPTLIVLDVLTSHKAPPYESRVLH